MRALFGLAVVCTVFAPLPVRAQDWIQHSRPENGYWSVGRPRLFVSTRSEAGVVYAKPYVSAGFGMPHWIWVGVDVNAIATIEFFQAYSGVRASTPLLDLAFGFRDTWSFIRPFLAPAARFRRADVMDAPGPAARYWAWEAEALAIAPLPYSALVVDFIAVRTLDVPDGMYVYDESYRVVVKDPLFFVLRAAAVARVLNEDALKAGVLTETAFGTGRDRPVFRVGPAASLQLTDHLEVNMAVTLAVSSPDALGLLLGAYGVAGVRYRWASGERAPAWPWRGRMIP